MKQAGHPVCARFHKAVELIGARWSGAILQTVLEGPTRYASIRDSVPEISDRMLSERLRLLEKEGLVSRRVFPETPVRIEYELTAKGHSLERALGAIAEWAEEWIPLNDEAPTPVKESASGPRERSNAPARPERPRIKPRIAG
jgi:DNA-binding HxlR family transcriptional regulator